MAEPELQRTLGPNNKQLHNTTTTGPRVARVALFFALLIFSQEAVASFVWRILGKSPEQLLNDRLVFFFAPA